MVVLDLMHCGKARDDVKETGDGQESCAGGHYRITHALETWNESIP